MAWPSVKLYTDEPATPENLNRPVSALAQRTSLLRQRMDTEAGDPTRRSTRFVDVQLDKQDLPPVPCVVHWDAAADLYRPALATVSLGNVVRDLDEQGYAVGVLIQVDPATATGTVVTHGYASDLDVHAMMETGQQLIPGPLFLSSSQSGKLTCSPAGPAVYVGLFDTDQGLINPQYRDFAEAHVHRGVVLSNMPQGAVVPVYADLTGTPVRHWVRGLRPLSALETSHGSHTGGNASSDLVDSGAWFSPDDLTGLFIYNVTQDLYGVITANNTTTLTTVMEGGDSWDSGDEYFIFERARLTVEGPLNEAEDVTYTVTLTDQSGLNEPSIIPAFGDVWLRWVSSDPEEGTGLVRVLGYDQPIPIGTRGVRVRLENMAAVYPHTAPRPGLWTSEFLPGPLAGIDPAWGKHPVGTHDEAWRSWEIDVTALRGWRQHDLRAQQLAGTAPDVAVTLRSVDYDYDAKTLRLACGHLARVSWGASTPVAGSRLQVGGITLEFSSGGPVSAGALPVDIITGDVQATLNNAVAALLDSVPPHIHVLQSQTGADTEFWMVAAAVADLPVLTGATNLTVTTFMSGTNPDPGATPAVRCMLYDDEFRWIPHATQPHGVLRYWTESVLGGATGLSYYAHPVEPSAVVGSVAPGSVFEFDVSDLHAGYNYEYSMDLDPELSPVFPPQPRNAGVLVLGGMELPTTQDSEVEGLYTVTRRTLLTTDTEFLPWEGGVAKFYLPTSRAMNSGIVRTLRTAPGSGLRAKRCGTREPASVGDLELDFELDLSTRATGLPGWLAVKAVRQQQLLTGPVVSRIRNGNWYTVRSRGGAPQGSGEVELVLEGLGRAGGFVDIALENGKTDVIGMFPYIKLLPRTSGVRSGFVARFSVPWQMEGMWGLLIDFHAFGTADVAAGPRHTFGLDVTYNLLRAYDPENESGSTLVGDLVESAQTLEWAIPLGTEADGYAAYAPSIIHTDPQLPADEHGRLYRAESGPFPRAGDLKGGSVEGDMMLLALRPGTNVAIRFENAERGDNPYAHPLGIMNLQWRLVPIL